MIVRNGANPCDYNGISNTLLFNKLIESLQDILTMLETSYKHPVKRHIGSIDVRDFRIPCNMIRTLYVEKGFFCDILALY